MILSNWPVVVILPVRCLVPVVHHSNLICHPSIAIRVTNNRLDSRQSILSSSLQHRQNHPHCQHQQYHIPPPLMRSAVTMISTAVTMISNAVILSSWCLWIWVLVEATVCLLSSDSSPRLQLDSSTWQLLRDACYQNQDHCPDSEHQDYWILKVNFINLCMWTNCFINININISINIVKGWKGSVVLFDEIDRSECGSRGGSQPNLWHIVFPVNILTHCKCTCSIL